MSDHGENAPRQSELSLDRERARRHERTIRIADQYRNGVSLKAICYEFGISKSHVLRVARLFGLRKRNRFDPRSIREMVLAQYISGMPIAEIAAFHGIAQSYVSKIAGEEGILRRKFKPRLVTNS